jgi:hypothetical protein
MMMIATERRKGAKRVRFENPLDVRVMAIDGTWCIDSQLIDVSETGARIRLTSSAAKDIEFFLLLTKFGDPVFRRCKRRWVNGTLMGVSFSKDAIGAKPLAQLRREAELVYDRLKEASPMAHPSFATSANEKDAGAVLLF